MFSSVQLLLTSLKPGLYRIFFYFVENFFENKYFLEARLKRKLSYFAKLPTTGTNLNLHRFKVKDIGKVYFFNLIYKNDLFLF